MRTKQADIEQIVRVINTRRGIPGGDGWVKGADGRFHSIPGAITLDGAYGGWQVQEFVTEGGAVRTISHGGYISKREIFAVLNGILAGMELAEREVIA